MNLSSIPYISLLAALIWFVEAKITVDLLGYYECPNYPKGSQDIDFSNMDFNLDDDGFVVMNGNLTILREIAAPHSLRIYSERLERGEWHPAMLNRKVDNFCSQVLNPTESWYPFTSRMKRRMCPFPAGYVETVRNLRLSSFPYTIPPSFLGEWKVYSESHLAKGEKKVARCCR